MRSRGPQPFPNPGVQIISKRPISKRALGLTNHVIITAAIPLVTNAMSRQSMPESVNAKLMSLTFTDT
jgi:regulator of PEP synthase PpsR (kinase-PPPase family)